MSKDKGTKNVKKAPADKSAGKKISSYKSESKSGITKAPGIAAFIPKQDPKTGGSHKS